MKEDTDLAVSSFDHAIAETAMRYSGAVGIGTATDAVEVRHDICVVYCIEPRRKHRHLGCPSCYSKIAIRDIYANEIEPAGTRFMWLAGAFLGGWAAAWRDATVGMVRGGLPGDVPPRDGRYGRPRAPERMTMMGRMDQTLQRAEDRRRWLDHLADCTLCPVDPCDKGVELAAAVRESTAPGETWEWA